MTMSDATRREFLADMAGAAAGSAAVTSVGCRAPTAGRLG
jgi:hypothetical protein